MSRQRSITDETPEDREPVVTYSRVAAERPAAARRVEATEIPVVSVDPADAIGVAMPGRESPPAADAYADLPPRSRGARRGSPLRFVVAAAAIIVVAGAIGVGVASIGSPQAERAATVAEGGNVAAEIVRLRAEIDEATVAADRAATAAREKIDALRARLATLESTPVPAEEAPSALPAVRSVTAIEKTADDVAAPPVAVAAVPPIPRARPDRVEEPAAEPGTFAPLPIPADPGVVGVPAPAPAGTLPAAPPPPEQDFVRNIERILADTPDGAAIAPETPTVTAAEPEPEPVFDPDGASIEWAPILNGPVPPEPIPEPAPPGGIQ